MKRPLVASIAIVLSAASAAAGADFTQQPAVKADGDNVRIEFAVDRPTDVEVAVLDAGGRVVRHLAGGVVGQADAPPPLTPGSLSQSLLWDRTDDAGRPAPPEGNFVRVRLGMRVTFGRYVGGDPTVIDTPRGLATDAAGNVYLMSQSYRPGDGKSAGPRYLQVFDRAGSYLRTIMPYRSDLPREAVAGFGLIDAPGPLTPRNQEGVWPVVYDKPDLHLQSRPDGAGRLALCDDENLYFMDARGAAADGFKGIRLWPIDKPRFSYNRAGPMFVAFAPDGKRLYIAGPYADPAKADAKMLAAWPKGRVYVLDLAKGGAVPFLDVPVERDRDLEVPDSARTLRRAPHGPVHDLATDAKGNLYVCDRANDRVAVFDPAGKPVGQIPVRQPHRVAVAPGSGEIFVIAMRPLAYGQFETRLLKFAGLDARGPQATMNLPGGAGRPIMAIDASVRPAAVWLTAVTGCEVWRVEQRGGKLKVVAQLKVSDRGALWGADRIAVDYETDDVYVNDGWSSLFRYNGLTGQGGVLGDSRLLRQTWERDTNQRTNLTATDVAVGPDGFVYLRNGPRYSGPVTRWDRRMRPAPLTETHSHVFTKYVYSRYGAGYGERGFAIAADGRLFMMSMYDWSKYFVHAYRPDGSPIESGRLQGQVRAYDDKIRSGLIGPLTGRCGGLKLDAAGNIYVGMQMLPDGFKRPAGFETDPAYNNLTGSVFKFTPEGGGIGAAGGGPGLQADVPGITIGRTRVAGAIRVYPDLAPFSGGYGSGCACRNPRFDIDPFGRLYLPNAIRFSVAVLDNAGNELLRFGQYGNMDEKGAGARIPLGWPIAVGVSADHVYVSDMLNKRVVRGDLEFARTAKSAVPAGPAVATKPTPAEQHAAAALAEAGKLSPAIAGAGWLARSLPLALARQARPATTEDARVCLLQFTRLLADWPADQARPVAARYLADPSPRVRLAALWALDRDGMADVTVALNKAALADKDQRVRTLAAVFLLDRGHGDGLAILFTAARGKDEWVLDMARPAAQDEVILDGGPRYLKAAVTARDVDQVLRLLHDPYNNMRAVSAGVLMLCGDPRAGQALADRLGAEEISFVRRRIISGLVRLRARAGVGPLLADVAAGPGDRKKGTGWQAAEALADIGDPAMVESLIATLDQPKSKDLALFALSRAFDEQITAASDDRLAPDSAGKLRRVPKRDLPPAGELKAAWQAWWKAHASDYKWSDAQHPLRAGR